MLEQVDLNKSLKKSEVKKEMEKMEGKLSQLQRECKELGIPVLILFEGFGAAGKGVQISQLIHPLDPRGFEVFTINEETKHEKRHPFLWRFWTKIPAKGRIHIFDRSWYRKVLVDRFDGNTSDKELGYVYHEICTFEQELADSGMVLLKFFLCIDKKEQKKRFDKLISSKETAWRVTKADLKRNKEFDRYRDMSEEMLEKTDSDYAPWYIIESMDKEYATVKIYTTVIHRILEEIEKKKSLAQKEKHPAKDISGEGLPVKLAQQLGHSSLSNIDLSLSYTKEEYKEKLIKLQNKVSILHNELYRRRIPLIIGFEGWDAGGKGGAIKRLTEKMDPRGYVVNLTAAPNDIEKAHHYLWRFWQKVPKAGHVAIFDRTWYGRVMVERIEGFCSKEEWQRAYKEINDMEADFTHSGAIVLKFWMQIDKDEQERRFKARMENPEKQWKITEEDWRNREKWDQYEEAVNEMIIRTSTSYAPWTIVEGNCKYYARIKVLETVIAAIEEKLKEK